tara:strand:+ start:3290 stop:5455 length:2166 start_codon:yes stop_codon:yes gene_type:complete
LKNNRTQSSVNDSNSFLINYFPKFLYLGVFAILCVPFVVFFEVFYPYTVPKALWVQALNWILLTVYLCGIIINKELYLRYKPKLNFIFYLYLIYIFAYLVSSIFGDNFTFSFFGEFQRMNGIYWHIHTLVFLFILSACSNIDKFFYNLFSFVFFTGFVLSIFYILEHYKIFYFDMPGYSDNTRAVFTIGNPGFAGFYMMLIFFIGFGLFKINFVNIPFSFLRLNKIKYTYQYYIYYFYVFITMFLLLYAIFLTAARSVIPGLIAGMTMYIILLFYSFKGQVSQRNLIKLISVILIVFLSVFFFFLFTGILDSSLDRFANIINDPKESGDMGLYSRLSNINVTIRAFFERPLFGYGMNNFAIPYNQFVIPSQITSLEMDNAHNLFLHILSTGGILTLFIYLYLIFVIMINSIRNGRFIFSDKNYSLPGIMFVIPVFFTGYFIHQLFWFDIHETYLLIMIMLAIMNVTVKAPEFITKRLFKIQKFIKMVFGSIISKNTRFVSISIIISIFLIFINVELKMYQTASDIWIYSQIDSSETRENEYFQSKVIQILKATNRFPPMSNAATTFLINDSILWVPSLKEPSRSQLLNVAFVEGQNAIDKHPNYWKLHARLGVLYYEALKISENEDDIIKYSINAEKLFKASINLGPSRAAVYKMLMNVYLYNDEYEKAEKVVEKYKNYLNSINIELDSRYYQMNSMMEYENCTRNTKEYLVIKNCIEEIK